MIRVEYTEPNELLEIGSSVLNEVSRALPYDNIGIDADTDGLSIVLEEGCHLTEGAVLNDVCRALPFDGVVVKLC